jgi:hypothetical protein
VEAERRQVTLLVELAVVHSQDPGRTLGPDRLDLILKVAADQALEHRPDQLPMGAHHRLTHRRVQQQGNQIAGVGVHPRDLGGLDGKATAPGQRLDGLQTTHRGAAQNPGDGVIAQLNEQAVGFSAARLRQGPEPVGAGPGGLVARVA